MSDTHWRIVFYEDRRKQSPVEEFINGLTLKEQIHILHKISLLQELGPYQMGEQVKHMEGKLSEFRLRLQRRAFRIFFYVPTRGTIVFLHIFVKASNRTPRHEIDIALGRLQDHLASR